jgi:hypothetical protein
VFAVTTVPVSAPARLVRPGAPARRRPAPVRQRASTAVLVVGTLLSLGSLVGPEWALRAGVVIALASATLSCALGWRELYLTKRECANELLAAGRRHTDDLRVERQHNAEVLTTVTDRAQRWRQEVDRQQMQISGLRVETTALRGDLSSVRRQLVRAEGTIAGLRETVRDRDIEIALMRSAAPAPTVEVDGLPRRLRLDRAEVAAPTGGDSVIDFRAEAPVLPNFEADRRRA